MRVQIIYWQDHEACSGTLDKFYRRNGDFLHFRWDLSLHHPGCLPCNPHLHGHSQTEALLLPMVLILTVSPHEHPVSHLLDHLNQGPVHRRLWF